MHYSSVLDEISEERLQLELTRRKTLRDKGLCDYCERSPSATPCRFPERHKAGEVKTGNPLPTAVTDGEYDPDSGC